MKDPKAYADGLRELAQFAEDRMTDPEQSVAGVEVNMWFDSFEKLGRITRSLGGNWDKREIGHWLTLERSFGPHVVHLNLNRDEVCEKVQTGTRTVLVPDPEFVANAPIITIEEPVYGWKCPDSVLAS